LKNEAKSGDMAVLGNLLVKKASGKWSKINPATGVKNWSTKLILHHINSLHPALSDSGEEVHANSRQLF